MTDPNIASGPAHLAPGDTVLSSSPSVTLGPAKAIASGVTGTAIGFLTALGVAFSDNVVTGGEWIAIATATVLAAAAAFGITYATPVKVTAN